MTEQVRLGRITETTIRNALLYIRAECLREGAPGIEHVDALLRQRGHDPEAFTFAKRTPKAFRKGELQRKVLKALRDGPKTGPEIVRAIDSPLPYRETYRRVYVCLHRLGNKGIITAHSRLWRLIRKECTSPQEAR